MTQVMSSPATIQYIPPMLDFIKEKGVEAQFSQKILLKLTLISEEIIVNIVKYAYSDTRGRIFIQCEVFQDEKLVVTIKNSGVPFNPLEKESPDTTLPLEERTVGGLGIFLAIKMADTIEYRHENGENILSFTVMSSV